MQSRKRSNTLLVGLSTLLLFASGLLLLLKIFRKKGVSSMIQDRLKAAGYGENQARFWAMVGSHESRQFKSQLYTKYHNIFGMTQPKVRPTTSIGAVILNDVGRPTSFATFKDDESSVDDLVLYLKYDNYPTEFGTLLAQVTFMKSKGYFGADLMQYFHAVGRQVV